MLPKLLIFCNVFAFVNVNSPEQISISEMPKIQREALLKNFSSNENFSQISKRNLFTSVIFSPNLR